MGRIGTELDRTLIFLRPEAKDCQTLLQLMGNEMIAQNYAKKGYADALILREQEFPTGLAIRGIGVAIPHTDPSYVKREGLAIAILREPVNFHQMGEEKAQVSVRLVFLLMIENTELHMEYLQELLQIIRDREILQNLLQAETEEQAVQIIRKKEAQL